LAENPDFCLRHLHSVRIFPSFGTENLEWCGYTRWRKKIEDMFIRFDTIQERDGHTDTAYDG